MTFETAAKPARLNLRHPDVMETVRAEVERHYRSTIVEQLRSRGGVVEAAGLKVRLAKEFGFCYGVQRAIDLAYAARRVFAEQTIYILGEIIHNPDVNQQLLEMGIRFLLGPNQSAAIRDVTAHDVVIIPAFGAPLTVMEQLRATGCQLVDTTCGDVMSVWKRVTQNTREAFTSIIHGKSRHEETLATVSRAGRYLVVLNLAEADRVCRFIREGGDAAEFLRYFAGAHSPGFDPTRDLTAIGVANQTTMLRSETEEIQRRLRQAMVDRYGTAEIDRHYRMFDTICGATQERQDALLQLLNEPLDLILVIGGYNSSNTLHLAELAQAKVPTYFICNATEMYSAAEIQHFDVTAHALRTTPHWLPAGPLYVGITAGASCPNHLIDEVLRRLFALRGVSLNLSSLTTS